MSLDMADNYLHVQEIDFEDPDDEYYPGIFYSIDVQARFTFFPDDDDDNVMEAMERLKKDIYEIEAEDLTKTFLQNMFQSMDVPVDERMIEKVLACANRMAQSDRYGHRKVRRMQVKVDMFVKDPRSTMREVEMG
ncbi:hypothetical protein SLE2022_058280 [Rubroshorea leprosula]